MAGAVEMTKEQQRKVMVELMWLEYFNQAVYEKGLITETERNKITNIISRRRPSLKLY